MSNTNKQDVLPSWPMPLLSNKALLAVVAVLPVVAYPFLPSVGRSGVRCQIFLVWPSLFCFALVQIIRVLEWGSGRPYFGIDSPWLYTLLWCSTTAGLKGLLMPRGRKPKPEDFSFSATSVVFIFYFSNLFDDVFVLGHAETGWLGHLLRLLIINVGTIVVGYAFYWCLDELSTIFLFRFTTRQVPWWYWLPENGAADDFRPGWSIALAVAVAIMPLLVLFAAIVNVGVNVRAE